MLNWITPRGMNRADPRTAIGLSRDRKTLVMLVADGRRGRVAGMSGFQMAAVMREFGAWDALNLDGGGSCTLVIDGQVRNEPSDGRATVWLTVRNLGRRTWHAAGARPGSPIVVIDDGAVTHHAALVPPA